MRTFNRPWRSASTFLWKDIQTMWNDFCRWCFNSWLNRTRIQILGIAILYIHTTSSSSSQPLERLNYSFTFVCVHGVIYKHRKNLTFRC
jgi:hypothetical protein